MAAMFLSGCSRDNRSTDIKVCTAAAEKIAQNELPYVRSSATEEERHDDIGSEVANCMAAKGYRHDNGAMADGRCVPFNRMIRTSCIASVKIMTVSRV